ncbi:MAG: sulfotransferase [Myxococcota bacterium]
MSTASLRFSASQPSSIAPSTTDELVELLSQVWQGVLGRPVGRDEDFFALGGTSVQAVMITNRVQDKLGAPVHPAAIFDAPTIAMLAGWVRTHHPEIFGRSCSGDPLAEQRVGSPLSPPLRTEEIERARQYFANPDLVVDRTAPRNRPAIFILCPPRSGSTLLRVMLAGHSGLFSPPELYLLPFDTLAARRTRFSGRVRFMGEGLTRAVMALRNLTREDAEALVDRLADEGTSIHQLYALLQEWAGGRRLVDKTPDYSLDPTVLRRAEHEFDGALFIHMVRHPMACVASFVEARADLATGEHDERLPSSARKRGELWWLVGQSNIVEFLREIPAERQVQVRFEELVARPEAVMRTLSDRLGISFSADMLEPHADRVARMTDGITEHSRMLGDQAFHRHHRIDPTRADRWRAQISAEGGGLCEATWELACSLGYEREELVPEREEWEI